MWKKSETFTWRRYNDGYGAPLMTPEVVVEYYLFGIKVWTGVRTPSSVEIMEKWG